MGSELTQSPSGGATFSLFHTTDSTPLTPRSRLEPTMNTTVSELLLVAVLLAVVVLSGRD